MRVLELPPDRVPLPRERDEVHAVPLAEADRPRRLTRERRAWGHDRLDHRESLERCSCSVDVVASILPYDKYVQAETILSMRQGVGQQAATFKSVKMFDDMVANLRRAQAEAEIRCFK